jgi:hypothetical protein
VLEVQELTKHSRFPEGLSPVQKVDGFWLKREDLWFRGDAHGSKCKVGFKIVGKSPRGIVGGSHRTSPQAERIALIGKELGVPAHVHTAAAAEESPVIRRCRELGATIHEHRPGYMNVVLKRAEQHAQKDGLTLVPWGMECETYVEEVAKQVQNLPWNDPDFERIVVPLGSGMALSGILRGLEKFHQGFPRPPILAVSVGSKTFESRLDQYAPENWRIFVDIVESKAPFDSMIEDYIGEVALDPQYEAKCVPFLKPGDLLWLVAHRDHPRLRK